MKSLEAKGIITKAYFAQLVHLTKFYREKFGYKLGYLPFTEKISNRVLSLPVYPDISRDEIEYVVERIKNFLER